GWPCHGWEQRGLGLPPGRPEDPGMTSSTDAAEAIAGHDLTGRETIVTGGYGAVGYETAQAFAGAGARVVLAGGDPDKGEAAANRLRIATGNDKVVFSRLDLASLESVTTWARKHAATGRPLHVLVTN